MNFFTYLINFHYLKNINKLHLIYLFKFYLIILKINYKFSLNFLTSIVFIIIFN